MFSLDISISMIIYYAIAHMVMYDDIKLMKHLFRVQRVKFSVPHDIGPKGSRRFPFEKVDLDKHD